MSNRNLGAFNMASHATITPGTQGLQNSRIFPRVALREAPRVKPPRVVGIVPHQVKTPWRDIELSEAAALGSANRIRKGQTISYEGDIADRCFEVIRGVVRTYKLLPDGRRQIVDFVFPGEILGLASGGVHGCSADAVTESVIRSFRRSTLERLANENPVFSRTLREAAYRELRAAQAHITLLGRKTAFERVASFLLSLARRTAGTAEDANIIAVPMSQSDIADYLGLTTETVNRIVSQLREQGVVTVPARGTIRLERPKELKDLACAA
jgi:CRP/FNR family transcriptional regulator